MTGQHIVFDIVAWLSALGTTWLLFHWRFRDRVESFSRKAGAGYFAALTVGGLLGAYGFGTLNVALSGQPGLGRSIVGGLVGAIAMVELYKLRKGIRGSTGAILAVPFCVAIAIGRLGCFTAGLDDYAFGVPTTAPWGVDFGDGVMRHPVQLYEAATMILTAVFLLAGLWRRAAWFMNYAFYAVVFVYAAQRFALEFLKPYATLVGPLNVFHFLCLALLVYTAVMVYLQKHDDA